MEKKKQLMKYEAPRMMSLGNLATGFGGCLSGSSATGNCTNGPTIAHGTGQCNTGNSANNHCTNGGADIG